MRNRLAIYSTLMISLILFVALPVSAQDTKEDEKDAMTRLRERLTGMETESVNVISRGATEINGDWITLREDAEVNIGLNRSILADIIEYNPKENLIRARGNVVLLESKMRISGDEVELNLEENSGFITNPYIETEEGYLIRGSRLTKVGPDEYKIEDSTITSCNQPRPNWNMAASTIYLKQGDYASLTNFRLRVADALPILYLPWMRIPYDRERATGFLMPEFGTSDYHGNWLSQKFFWAINDQHDATVGADYYEERGIRYLGEYRNNLGAGNQTSILWEYIDDDTFPKDRFNAKIRNNTALPAGFGLNVNLEFISDDTYKRDFFNRNTFRNPYYRKSVFLTNNSYGLSFLAGYSDIDRFLSRNKISQIRYLPSVRLASRDRQVLDTPIYFNFSGSFDRPAFRQIFRRSEFDKEDLITEKAYNRFDLQGQIKMPIKTFAPWLSITPSVSGRYTYYTHQWDSGRRDFLEESVSRNYMDFGIEAIGPVFSKIYGDPVKSDFLFKHVVRPSFAYKYRSDLDFEDRANLIILDQTDTIFRMHEVKWSLENTVYMKDNKADRFGNKRVTELFRFGVTQYISMEDDLLTSFDRRYVFNPNNINVVSRYSPLLFNGSVNIFRSFNINTTLEYDINESEVNNFSVGGNLRTSWLNAYSAWYRTVGAVRIIQGQLRRSSTNRYVGRGSINLGVMSVNGLIDYDITNDRILSYLAGADFHTQCFGMRLEVLKMNQYGQGDIQTRFSISLGGLGGILGGGE